jgi:two-component system LytT family response regulator
MKRSFIVLEGITQIQKEFKKVQKVDFIAVPSVSKIDVLKVDKLLYCEAEGRYTTFYLEDGKTITSSKNLGEYEKQLPNDLFFRIHHKYLINLKKVSSINKEGGRYCEMLNNSFLPISKRKQEEFNRFLRLK